VPVIPKWSRFEQTFESAVLYSNALQDATLTAVFTSPLGGVRFSPNQPGRWTYRTACSDTANAGLHDRSGEFLCSPPSDFNRFDKHGPVQVARDHRHLEHADGTPFFWMADTAWSGARAAEPKDWEVYAVGRFYQNFTVIQWAVGPGEDYKAQSAIAGFEDRIAVNPGFFQRLDGKIEKLNEVGLLSAIAPLFELGVQKDVLPALPDDQVALFVRYVVARYGADPVVWLLAFEGDSPAQFSERWKRIGQGVFSEKSHAPVLVLPGADLAALNEFRNLSWVDILGCQAFTDLADNPLQQTLTGPYSKEWTSSPAHPLISFLPHENAVNPATGKRYTADEVRRAAYWSLLLTRPAGISYGADGVLSWDETKESGFPLWKRSLFLPAGKQMGYLASYMSSIDFWRLEPQPKALVSQPGNHSPTQFVAAAVAEARDFAAVYVPDARALELQMNCLPQPLNVSWFNPRTGQDNPASLVVAGSTCQFLTPDPGDWLLQVKAGKP
jgi:hypothetical protein